MRRQTLVFLPLIFLLAAFAARTPLRAIPADSSGLDHITMYGPSCPLFPCADTPLPDHIRYLIGHWSRDFEITVVEAADAPNCRDIADRTQCSLRVKQVQLILGHQESASTRTQSMWRDSYEINYAFPNKTSPAHNANFDVKRGDHLIAFLTPAMHPENKPGGYIATRLDHADDALVESVSTAVAGTLYQALAPHNGDKTP